MHNSLGYDVYEREYGNLYDGSVGVLPKGEQMARLSLINQSARKARPKDGATVCSLEMGKLRSGR